MKFNKLDVPYQWKEYFTKYPHGYTIFEALCSWTKQVDDMVDNVNDWNDYLDNFVENFEFELQEEVQSTIAKWQSEGLLDAIIESALNTELDNVKSRLEEIVQVSVKQFGAKGDGISDDTNAFIDLINYINATDHLKNITVLIPIGRYKITSTLPTINKPVKIVGGGKYSTCLQYTPNEHDTYLFKSNVATWTYGYHIEIVGLTIRINSNGFRVGGVEAHKFERGVVGWGVRVHMEDVYITGYTTFGTILYAPYLSSFKNCSFISNESRLSDIPPISPLPPTDNTAIGVCLSSYDIEKNIDTVGTLCVFETCEFIRNRYGVRIKSTTGIQFNSCCFENNYIDCWATSEGERTSRVVFETCHFEIYRVGEHPTMRICDCDFNETTGQIVLPMRYDADVLVRNPRLGGFEKLGLPFNNGIYQRKTNTYIEKPTITDSTSPFYSFKTIVCQGDNDVERYLFMLSNRHNYIGLPTSFKRGMLLLPSNTLDNIYEPPRYIKSNLTTYSVNNPNENKSDMFSHTVSISDVEGKILKLIMNFKFLGSGGETVVCRLELDGYSNYGTSDKVTTKVIFDRENRLRPIDGGDTIDNNMGVNVVRTNNILSFKFKGYSMEKVDFTIVEELIAV